MYLATIAPGEPCEVSVYACAPGSKLRTRLVRTTFNRTPDRHEIAELLRKPEAFVATIEGAAA